MLALITPESVRERHALVRFFVAGGTLAALTVSALIGVVAMAALVFAVAAIYFLTTQVLGLKVNIDPQAFYQQFQQQAAQSYGAN